MRKEIVVITVLSLGLAVLILTAPHSYSPLSLFTTSSADPYGERDQRFNAVRDAARASLLEHITSILPEVPSRGEIALVYSRYPFNFKQELTVDAGSVRGIRVGQPVLFREFLVGVIEMVFGEQSRVRTIFDPRWQSAVRIGSGGAEALLVGGSIPLLTLLDPAANVREGEPVYSVDRTLPYGLPLGTIGTTRPSHDAVFMEAELRLPYTVRDVHAVIIDTEAEAVHVD